MADLDNYSLSTGRLQSGSKPGADDGEIPLSGSRAFLRGGGAGSIYGTKNTRIVAGGSEMGTRGLETARKRSERSEKTDGTAIYHHPSGKYEGTGEDCPKSPLSNARETWGSKPTTNPKDWG